MMDMLGYHLEKIMFKEAHIFQPNKEKKII